MTNEIYSDEFVKIFALSDGVYIESLKSGLSLEHLYHIISSHPRIQITNIIALRDAINSPSQTPQKFAELKEPIVVSVTNDNLKATITFNLTKQELEMKNRENLAKNIFSVLGKMGITYGVKREVVFSDFENGKSYIIAEGTAPVDGKDCVIKMYKLDEPKPQIKQDGKVNYYELKLINKVKSGDWLGERIDATEGIPGRSVFGKSIPAVKGKNFPLMFDKNTVYEVPQNGIRFLYSKINGAVSYVDGRITVSNYLEIDGDVDFKTGNIKFDGYVTIHGTVTDGFSVEATKDIEINSNLGLGNVKGINSIEGSIYIKGGIASKNPVDIRAKKNVFIKFLDNTSVFCEGIVNVGFYCLNSFIEAKEVFVESIKGSIIGGSVKAEIKIVCPAAGSSLEKRTVLHVVGFDRKKLTEKLAEVNNRIINLRDIQQDLKRSLNNADTKNELTAIQIKEYNNNFQKIVQIKEEIKSAEEEKKDLMHYLRTRGEGEITIIKSIFANCILIIKNKQIDIKASTMGATYFYSDGALKF